MKQKKTKVKMKHGINKIESKYTIEKLKWPGLFL